MINLKSNKTLKEIIAYKKVLENLNLEKKEVVLYPSSIYLPFFYEVPYKLGSQNVSIYEYGSHTGEILATQLFTLHVRYVLLNHAETKDTLENVIKRIKNASKENLRVVLCIGEEEKKESQMVLTEVTKKIADIFINLTFYEQNNIILAYEPIWAINKENTLDPEELELRIKRIKEHLTNTYHLSTPVLYGGSINTTNIDSLLKIDIIDGYLIGNCAKNPENILEIAEKF